MIAELQHVSLNCSISSIQSIDVEEDETRITTDVTYVLGPGLSYVFHVFYPCCLWKLGPQAMKPVISNHLKDHIENDHL